jgi:hypothetical protein
MKCILLATSALLLSACAAEPVDHADPGPEGPLASLETRQLAVSCDPKLLAYPILGPHNGGWDPNALDYTCPPHPGSSPDNSDWIPGDHYGNDLFAAKGELAVAPVDGVVVKSGWTDIGGWRVTLEDACGWWYYSAHLDALDPAAQLGAALTAGQIIGEVGNSGSAQGTSPHIHFSIYPDGAYTSGVDPFPYLQAVDAHACDEANVEPPPPSSECPSGQTTTVCDGSTWLLTCVNGTQTANQDCGAMGGYCTTTLGPQAVCVSTACTPSPNVAPTPGTALCVAGVRHVCDASGWPSPSPCPAGQGCVGAGQCDGPQTDPQCPDSGNATLCNGVTTYVSCGNGVKTGEGDCAIFGGVCVELVPGDAACVDALCAEPLSGALVEHALCLEGVRHVCDETGWSTEAPCPEGLECNGAGDCASGYSDDCVGGRTPEPERCNQLDDDCDGVVDESLSVILGSPCLTDLPDCDALGMWGCGLGEMPVCVTDPALCPGHSESDTGDPWPAGDSAGGVFTPADQPGAPPEQVSSTCAGAPAPSIPLALLLLALTAWTRGRRRPME